jgi:hypothetical protein
MLCARFDILYPVKYMIYLNPDPSVTAEAAEASRSHSGNHWYNIVPLLAVAVQLPVRICDVRFE